MMGLDKKKFDKKLLEDRNLQPFISKSKILKIYNEVILKIKKKFDTNDKDASFCYLFSKECADSLKTERYFCQKIIGFSENLLMKVNNDITNKKELWGNHQAVIVKVAQQRKGKTYITNMILDPLLNVERPMPFNQWTSELANLRYNHNFKKDVIIYYEMFPSFLFRPMRFSFTEQFDLNRYEYLEEEKIKQSRNFNDFLNPNPLI